MKFFLAKFRNLLNEEQLYFNSVVFDTKPVIDFNFSNARVIRRRLAEPKQISVFR